MITLTSVFAVLFACASQMTIMHRLFKRDYSLEVFEPSYFLYMGVAAIPIFGAFIWLIGAMDLDYRLTIKRKNGEC